MKLPDVLRNWPTVIREVDPWHDLPRCDASSTESATYKDIFSKQTVSPVIAKTIVSAASILSDKKETASSTFTTMSDLAKPIGEMRKSTASSSFEQTFLNATLRLGEKANSLKVEEIPNEKLAARYGQHLKFSEAHAAFPKQMDKNKTLHLAATELDPAVCKPHMSRSVKSGEYTPTGAALGIKFNKKTKTLTQVASFEGRNNYEFGSSLSNALISGAVGNINDEFVGKIHRSLGNERGLTRIKENYTRSIISCKGGVSTKSLERYKKAAEWKQENNEDTNNSEGKENYAKDCEEDDENATTLSALIIDYIVDELRTHPELKYAVIAEKIRKKVLEYKSDGDYRQVVDCVQVAGTRHVIGSSNDRMCNANMLAVAMREGAPLSVVLEFNDKTTTVATTTGKIDSKKAAKALFWVSGGKKSAGSKKSSAKNRKTRRNRKN